MSVNEKHKSIRQVRENLFQISLPIPLRGFDGFVNAWVYTGGPVVLVDPGPGVGIPGLLKALASIGVRRLDYILLTHIHIDHAGGAGIVAETFKDAQVVCHSRGIAHLVEPEQLWQGSLKTLADVARAYGPIAAIDQQRLIAADDLDAGPIHTVETLGHCAHHCSFIIDGVLFCGEAGGVCLTMPENLYYLRPATPPRFFLETSLNSIDRLLETQPTLICYGHVGARDDASVMLRLHRDQLMRWADAIRPWRDRDTTDNRRDLIHACCASLLDKDPLLNAFFRLAPDVQERERGFLINSIKGYWQYLAG